VLARAQMGMVAQALAPAPAVKVEAAGSKKS